MVILQCWRWGVISVGSVRCSHHEAQLKSILEPRLLQRQSEAWQTIQNIIETNIDAGKNKWIAKIKFSLLARFRCCMWTSLLRKEKLVTFNLQTLKTFKYFATMATFDIVNDSWHQIITKFNKAVKKNCDFSRI